MTAVTIGVVRGVVVMQRRRTTESVIGVLFYQMVGIKWFRR
jgi:hypothetical protein